MRGCGSPDAGGAGGGGGKIVPRVVMFKSFRIFIFYGHTEMLKL